MSWKVVKFGGTSVSNRQNWNNIVEVVRQNIMTGDRLLIVCSAASQVSNRLERLIDAAILKDYENLLAEIQQVYNNLATELEVDFEAVLGDVFQELQKRVEGISLLGEASPRVHAQVMAFGELALTKLAAKFLQQQQVDVVWQDARTLLKAVNVSFEGDIKSYLQARCSTEPDIDVQKTLEELTEKAILTQGFIASNSKDQTVLLGRGGSDTSAAYFAAKLQANCCEIWTDVPGIYTANPQMIPEARFLQQLDYDEVQEIAAMGAKVLHPNCISPLKQYSIPLYVKYTQQPERGGTLVSNETVDAGAQIKSVLTKSDVILISIETVQMWHQAGFMARVFECFKKYNISVDLVSTSEANITVSLDQTLYIKNPDSLDALLDELNQFACAKTIGPCASISLVGRNVRSILGKLGHIFEVFESQQIHMLSLASNDLNVTFVVDESQATRLAQKLHILLIEQNANNRCFNKSWQEEFGQHIQQPIQWWQQRRGELLEKMEQHDAAFIYDKRVLKETVEGLLTCSAVDQFFYATKANHHAEILKIFYDEGIGFECVSLAEVNFVLDLFPEIDRSKVLFTPNFAPREEYSEALKLDIHVTIDNLYPIQQWPEVFNGKSVLIRVDLGHGDGHHRYVCTAGSESKFGIPFSEFDEVQRIVKENNINVIGLHSHSGSGILQPDTWSRTADSLLKLTQAFPQISLVNLGGGLGIVERPGQAALDLQTFNDSLLKIKKQFPKIKFWMEPGRYLVARSGVLLAKVTQIKNKGDVSFVGIATGMNSLIRPALYGSYHEIVNLTNDDQEKTNVANIVGPICESGDTLGYSRLLPDTQEGNVILIANTGAYGRVMSSEYNMRPPAIEIFLND